MSLPPQSPTPASTSQRLIVIDPLLAQDASLLAQLPEDATVLVLDPARGVLEQLIEAAAAQPQAIQTVDILSHGGEGFISLGGLQLDAASLVAHADDLALLGQWLAPGADLLLYGCSVAQGGLGQTFIEALAAATGTDVAASTDPTGATQLGGDSVLERWSGTGSLDAVPLDLSEWPGLLAVTPGLKDVLYTHTTSGFISGFTLTTSVPLGDTVPADPGIYLDVGTGNPSGWFEVSANGTELGGFDLTALTLAKYQNSAALTVTVVGTKLGSGETVNATITTAAGASTFVYPSFSAFTGLLKFRIEISGTPNASFVTFDSFSIANVLDPGAVGNQPPSLIATAVDPVFNEGASLPADLFRGVTASTTEGEQNIDRITLTVSGLANGAAELLRVDGQNLSLANGTTTTTPGLGLSASVSVSGGTATVTLSKAGGITSAQASALIDGLGYRNTADISADSTRVVTLTGLRDTGGTASGGVDAKTFNIASIVTLKAATGNAADELVDVLWHHTPSSFATGFLLATSTPLGTQGTSADPGIYLGGNGDGWFEVSANGTDVGGFDLTRLALDKYIAPNTAAGQFTITVIGTKLGSGDTVSATITSAAGSDSFVYPSFSAFTGLLKFRIEISGTQSAGFITFDSFHIDNVVAPGATGNQAPTLSATASNPIFNEGATLAADLFSSVTASASESTQNIDRITLTVSGLANGAGEILRVDGKSISLVNGATTTTPGLDLSASVSVSGNTATVTLTRTGGITSAQASAVIDGLGYRNAADINTDSTRVVTLTGLRDTGGTAGGGVDEKSFSIASTVHLKAATGDASDELVDVLWNHTTSSFATGFSLATSTPLGIQGTSADPGIYLGGNGDGWFEVSANGTDIDGFDLTGLALDKYATTGAFTITVIGTKLAGGSTVSATITSAAGSGGFVYPSFSAFTGLLKFRIEISGTENAAFVTFDSFRVANLVPANDAPVIVGLDGDSVTFTESGAPVLLDVGANATLTDADSPSFSGGTLTARIGANGLNSEDVLGIRNEGTAAGQISVSGSHVSYGSTVIGTVAGGVAGSPLVVTFNASSSPAAAQALIHNLTYSNSNSTTPLTLTRTVSVTVTDGAGGTSNTSNVTVAVTDVNDAPAITAAGRNPTYTEDGSAALLFSNVAVSTVEGGQNIRELKLTVTHLADAGNEFLVFDGSSIALADNAAGTTTGGSAFTYSVSVSGTTATVTLAKVGGVAASAVQTLLGSAGYLNTSDNPTTTSRVVTLTSISDTGGTANGGVETTAVSIASTITVVAVNDAPTLSGGPHAFTSTDEDTSTAGTVVSTLLGGLTFADADGPQSGVAVIGSAGHGTWQFSTDGATWTAIGTASAVSAVLLSSTTQVRYLPDEKNGEAATLTMRAWDQTTGTASSNGTARTADTTTNGGTTAFSTGTAQATLTVASVNDAPTDLTLSNATVAENSGAGALRTVGTLSTTDVDNSDTFTYSFAGGADDGLFELVGSDLRFKDSTPLDFETRSSYSVTLKTTDAGGLSFDKTFTVLLTDVNEAPVVAVPLMGQLAAVGRSFAYVVPAGTFTDPDTGNTATLAYSATLANGAALPSWLVFDTATRTFSGMPASGDVGTPSVRVTATDTGGLAVSTDFTLSVVNGPSVTGIALQAGASVLTNATTLEYVVTFSESVRNVDISDFSLSGPGATSGTVASVVASTPSSYLVTVTDAIGNGALRLDLKSIDTGIESTGNGLAVIGGYSAGASYDLDHSPPAAPSIALDATTDSGVAGDGITSDTSPLIKGIAEAGSTVSVYSGNQLIGTAGADATTGAWSLTHAFTADGRYLLAATARDAAGNISEASTEFQLTLDTVVLPPALALAGDTGASDGDGITNNATVNVTGLEPGAAWQYSINGGFWTAGTGSSFSLSEGSYATTAVQVRQIDVAGNTSSIASFGGWTIDTTQPTVSSVAVPANATYKLSQTLSFTVQFSESVHVTDVPRIALQIGTQTVYADYAGGTGTAALTFTATVLAGWEDTDGITVNGLQLNGGSLKDAAGNDAELPLNNVGSTTGVLVDGVAPAAPELALANDTGPSGTDGITKDGTVEVSGLEAGGSWEYSLDGGAHWLPGAGTSFTLAQGTYAAEAVQSRQTDAAGNVGDVALLGALVIDTTNPAAPALALALDRGASSSDGITSNGTVTVAGLEANARWEYSTDSGAHWFTGTGTEFALAEGHYAATVVQVRQTDAAGNLGSVGSAGGWTIDTTAPTLPTLDNAQIRSHVGADAVVGTLSATDTSAAALVFSLVDGNGSADNALFAISGTQLVLLDPAAAGASPRSVRVAVTDIAGNSSEQVFTVTVIGNATPTLAGIPAAVQSVLAGQTVALADFIVADGNGDVLTVTLTPTNGQIGGLPQPGSSGLVLSVTDGTYTLRGPAASLNALLADVTFTATAGGPASILIGVSDGIVAAPVTASYAFSAGVEVSGTSTADLLQGSSGDDRIDGAGGIDWLAYTGRLEDASVQFTAPGQWLVRSNTRGSDALTGVERLLFDDGAIALDVEPQGHAAQAAQLITALLGPQAIGDRALFGEILAYVDSVGAQGLTSLLQELGVLSTLAGGDSPALLATLLYTNLVGQLPNEAQVQELLDYQAAQGLDAAGLVLAASQLPLAAQRAGLNEGGHTGLSFDVFDGLLFGSSSADVLTAQAVGQHIDGHDGIDTLVYDGTLAQYGVHALDTGSWRVDKGPGGSDTLVNVERLQFADAALALDLQGHAGDAARLLTALAGAQALDDAALVGVALRAVDELGLDGAARLALDSGFANTWTGGNTLQQVIANAYLRIKEQPASQWELQALLDHAQAAGWDSAQALAEIARLPDTAQSIDLVGLAQQGLAYEPWIGG